MLCPDGAHLFVRGKLAARGSGLGFGHGIALVRREGNRGSLIGAGKLHDGTRNVVLIAWRQSAGGFKGLIAELGDGSSVTQKAMAGSRRMGFVKHTVCRRAHKSSAPDLAARP